MNLMIIGRPEYRLWRDPIAIATRMRVRYAGDFLERSRDYSLSTRGSK